jgi:CRISPR-associated endonuclease/helicase Cas3
MEPLLAKSPKRLADGGVIVRTLLQHTQDVVQAAQTLFGTQEPTRLARRWLEFFQIDDDWVAFRQSLLASCVIHDWGKANDGFQHSVRATGQQLIRHEHLSALLLNLPEVSDWLIHGGYDQPLVMSAVITHHLKAGDSEDALCGQLSARGSVVRLPVNHPDFTALLEESSAILNLPSLSANLFPARWSWDGAGQGILAGRDQLFEDMNRLEAAIETDVRRKRLLMATRSALICADAAGSGLARVGHQDTDAVSWIQNAITNRAPLTSSVIRETVIQRRVDEMIRAGRWEGFNQFQRDSESLPERALLLAPCGSGKTLAAWKWVAAQLETKPRGHALFLYPTRATAREGFKDYVSWAPEADATLMHGTGDYDLHDMFETPTDTDDRAARNYLTEIGLFSLSYWSKRAFSATVDQFLAFMQYSYGPICMLPVLVDSVIVIDEVHSFDRRMFASLKAFLRNFQVPVLCMTATLQHRQRNELTCDCQLASPKKWPDDLLSVASAPRYRLHRAANQHEAAVAVRTALAEGKRVLWVVNQVKRAHEIVRAFVSNLGPPTNDELRTPEGIPVVCYHSRFRLIDRAKRHQQAMHYLKPHWTQAALGVTTQVCEMSLDIDVDLLVTEECPVSSFVQRMGRCNRIKAPRPLAQSGQVIVYGPADRDTKPYSNYDLTGLHEFLNLVGGRDLSQEDLEVALLAAPSPPSIGDSLSMFVESGPFAVGSTEAAGQEFRDTENFTQQSVLPDDIANYLGNVHDRPGYVVPIPKGKVDRTIDPVFTRRLPRYLGVALAGHYHAGLGFCDFPVSDLRVK